MASFLFIIAYVHACTQDALNGLVNHKSDVLLHRFGSAGKEKSNHLQILLDMKSDCCINMVLLQPGRTTLKDSW